MRGGAVEEEEETKMKTKSRSEANVKPDN